MLPVPSQESKPAAANNAVSSASLRIFSTTSISPKYVNNIKNSYFLAIDLLGAFSEGYSLGKVKILYHAP